MEIPLAGLSIESVRAEYSAYLQLSAEVEIRIETPFDLASADGASSTIDPEAASSNNALRQALLGEASRASRDRTSCGCNRDRFRRRAHA